MAAPTYNCPYSSAAATSKQCATILAENTNSGCMAYDNDVEQCMIRQYLKQWRDINNDPGIQPADYSP